MNIGDFQQRHTFILFVPLLKARQNATTTDLLPSRKLIKKKKSKEKRKTKPGVPLINLILFCSQGVSLVQGFHCKGQSKQPRKSRTVPNAENNIALNPKHSLALLISKCLTSPGRQEAARNGRETSKAESALPEPRTDGTL